MAIGELMRRPSPVMMRRAGRDPFLSLQEEMNNLLENFWGGVPRVEAWAPNIDVRENKESVEVTAERPGLTQENIQLRLSDSGDILYLSGERKDEREEKREGYYRTERAFGTFQRSIPLPAVVEEKNAVANFKDGVLRVRLPKVAEEEQKGRMIQIKGE